VGKLTPFSYKERKLSKLGNLGNNKTAYADGDGGLIIETKVDLSDFIAETQAQYKNRSGSTGWGDNPLDERNKIATIPPEIIEDLNRKGIMRGYFIVDEPAMKRWLNDPINQVFRTRGGKV
jgi:hypothetical protein